MTEAHWQAYNPEHQAADRRQKQDLIAALNFAYSKGWILEAPKLSLPAKRPPRDRFLSEEQGQALLAAARPLHLRLFIMIALSTGARRGAILGLTWDRVLWDQSIIDFHDPTLPINKKRRASVKVQKPLIVALRDARELALSDHVIEFNGKPIKSVQTAFKKAAAAGGVPWATPHILKHTAISWLAELGWTVDQIADFTETNPDTVRRIYRKFSPNYLQDVSESLSNRLFAPTPLAQTQIRSVS